MSASEQVSQAQNFSAFNFLSRRCLFEINEFLKEQIATVITNYSLEDNIMIL